MTENIQAQELREGIRLLLRKLEWLNKSEASCCGMTLSQCHALVELGRVERLSLNELSELLGLDKSTLSRTVDNMVSNGLAERTIDSEDRRYVQIKLTEEGRTIYAGIESKMGDYFAAVLAGIPEEKRGQVIESMKYLLQAMPKNCC